MSDNTKTTEQRSNDLMAAIDYELDRYGAISLADFIASTIDGRCDDEQADHAYWRAVRAVFADAANTLETVNRRFKRAPTRLDDDQIRPDGGKAVL